MNLPHKAISIEEISGPFTVDNYLLFRTYTASLKISNKYNHDLWEILKYIFINNESEDKFISIIENENDTIFKENKNMGLGIKEFEILYYESNLQRFNTEGLPIGFIR